MPPARPLIVVATVAAAVVLFLVLRPGGDDAAPSGPQTSAPTQTTEGAPPTEPLTEAPDPEPQAFAIVLRNGLPEGGIQRLRVRRGDDVRIVVRSDAADDLHLHGYDLERSVAPGAPAQLRFRADVAGVFELETHRRHVVVAEIEVQP